MHPHTDVYQLQACTIFLELILTRNDSNWSANSVSLILLLSQYHLINHGYRGPLVSQFSKRFPPVFFPSVFCNIDKLEHF